MGRVALLCAILLAMPAMARPPDAQRALLSRGVNITGWFRYPTRRAPKPLEAWMADSAMADLRQAGFTFVRLAIDPAVVDTAEMRDIAVSAVCRFQHQGLAVVVDAHPTSWKLEDPAAQARLTEFWTVMAPALRRCDPLSLFPEILNEPVFAGQSDAWAALQAAILPVVRSALPDSTIVVSGHDWGSIAGLSALTPVADANVVYSVHFYEPAELTSLAAYRHDVDRPALATLPFPVEDQDACLRRADVAEGMDATAALMRCYCRFGWDARSIPRLVEHSAVWARAHDAVIVVGEFGASVQLNAPARLAWLRSARLAFEAAGFGWALWGYDDSMGFDVPRPPRNPMLDGNILTALGLPVQSR